MGAAVALAEVVEERRPALTLVAGAARSWNQPPPLREDPFAPPPEIIRWLYSSQSRVLSVNPDGSKRRLPRQRSRREPTCSLSNLFNLQAGLCCYCSLPMTLPVARRRLATDAQAIDMTEVTRDHIAPRSQGNPGRLFNFAAACRLCNQEKGDLPLVIYMLARHNGTVREMHRKQRHVRLALEASRREAAQTFK